jgi:hypothetical protein
VNAVSHRGDTCPFVGHSGPGSHRNMDKQFLNPGFHLAHYTLDCQGEQKRHLIADTSVNQESPSNGQLSPLCRGTGDAGGHLSSTGC